MLRIAAEDFALQSVHGGCSKDNPASIRAMEKGGMRQYGAEENGDPLYRFRAHTEQPDPGLFDPANMPVNTVDRERKTEDEQ